MLLSGLGNGLSEGQQMLVHACMCCRQVLTAARGLSAQAQGTDVISTGAQVGQFEGIIQHCLSTPGVHVIDLPINYAVSAQLQVSMLSSIFSASALIPGAPSALWGTHLCSDAKANLAYPCHIIRRQVRQQTGGVSGASPEQASAEDNGHGLPRVLAEATLRLIKPCGSPLKVIRNSVQCNLQVPALKKHLAATLKSPEEVLAEADASRQPPMQHDSSRPGTPPPQEQQLRQARVLSHPVETVGPCS